MRNIKEDAVIFAIAFTCFSTVLFYGEPDLLDNFLYFISNGYFGEKQIQVRGVMAALEVLILSVLVRIQADLPIFKDLK